MYLLALEGNSRAFFPTSTAASMAAFSVTVEAAKSDDLFDVISCSLSKSNEKSLGIRSLNCQGSHHRSLLPGSRSWVIVVDRQEVKDVELKALFIIRW